MGAGPVNAAEDANESMPHSATVQYDRTLVKRAIAAYFLRRLGRPLIFGFGLLLGLLGYDYLSRGWSLTSTYLAILIAATTLLLAIAYLVRLAQWENFFKRVDNPTVTYTFSEEGVTTESAIGSSTVKWIAFDEVLKCRDIWLLVYAKSGFLILPLDQLSKECQEFIEAQLSRKGK
jgi:hypothetical protein